MLKKQTIYIKNMLCTCCTRLIESEFNKVGINIITLRTGFAEIEYNTKKHTLESIENILKKLGMGLVKTREQQIVEQIKSAVFELIHQSNNINSLMRKSDYLVEKLSMSYQQLSKIFSHHEAITLEKYIIKNKIERIKELIDSNEYSLGEIAYMMDYSSVQYLSNQFKKETGMSVSEYKKSDKRSKKTIDMLLNDKNN
jgi:YesN/AraC family two-component response regulator